MMFGKLQKARSMELDLPKWAKRRRIGVVLVLPVIPAQIFHYFSSTLKKIKKLEESADTFLKESIFANDEQNYKKVIVYSKLFFY